MPAVFDRFGVRFLYPENWSLQDLEVEDWPRTVTLQSPQSSVWTLHVYPPGHEPTDVVDELVAAISAEFRDLEVLPAAETLGDIIAEGVDVAFFFLDLLVEAKIRHIRTPSGT